MKAFSFILIFCLALAYGSVVKVENGFADRKWDPKTIKISSIDKKEAESLFKAMADDKNIPYKYVIDGCYARATAMAKIAEKRDIKVGKIFAEGILHANFPDPEIPPVRWGWHVAPVVFVKSDQNQSIPMVFDPSLFDRAVTVEEWKKRMLYETDEVKPEITKLYYGSRFQYHHEAVEPSRSSWNPGVLEHSKKVLERYMVYQSLGEDLPNAARPAGGVN